MPLIDLSPKNSRRDLHTTQRGFVFNNSDSLFSQAEWDSDGDIAPFGYYDLHVEEDANGTTHLWFTDNKDIWTKSIEFCKGNLKKITIWNKSSLDKTHETTCSTLFRVTVAETNGTADPTENDLNIIMSDPVTFPPEEVKTIIDMEGNCSWQYVGGSWVKTPDYLLLDYAVGSFIFSPFTGGLYFVQDVGKIVAIMMV